MSGGKLVEYKAKNGILGEGKPVVPENGQSSGQIAPEQIDNAMQILREKTASAETIKQIALEKYTRAKADYDRYFSDRRFLMEMKRDSVQLRNDLREMEVEIAELEKELETTESSIDKANPMSFRHKKNLADKSRQGQTRKVGLEKDSQKIRALIPKIVEAENYVNGHTEHDLKAVTEAARKEAELN
jgi:hypothetical protein